MNDIRNKGLGDAVLEAVPLQDSCVYLGRAILADLAVREHGIRRRVQVYGIITLLF